MEHQLRLHPEPFEKIHNKKKTIESRLNDEKRQAFRVGDILTFTNRGDDTQIKTVITNLHHHQTFSALFSAVNLKKFGGGSLSELLEEIEIYYSKTEQEKYGVVGIEFKII